MSIRNVLLVSRPAAALVVLFASLAFSGIAAAQWQVHDTEANGQLSTANGHLSSIESENKSMHSDLNGVLGKTGDSEAQRTIDGYLNSINSTLKIGTFDPKKPGTRVADPDQVLPDDSAEAAKLDNGVRCDKVAEPQQATCKQIVAIENAQYKYMLTMYKNTATRYEVLKQLLDERNSINANDVNQFGKLEDNTNKLTALYNLLALDQQQMQTVNYAYEANLRYLRNQQALAAKSAATGEDHTSAGSISLPGIGSVQVGSVISGIAAGAALKEALKDAQSTAPEGILHLKVSDGTKYGL
jgi:hypothetical protein